MRSRGTPQQPHKHEAQPTIETAEQFTLTHDTSGPLLGYIQDLRDAALCFHLFACSDKLDSWSRTTIATSVDNRLDSISPNALKTGLIYVWRVCTLTGHVEWEIERVHRRIEEWTSLLGRRFDDLDIECRCLRMIDGKGGLWYLGNYFLLEQRHELEGLYDSLELACVHSPYLAWMQQVIDTCTANLQAADCFRYPFGEVGPGSTTMCQPDREFTISACDFLILESTDTSPDCERCFQGETEHTKVLKDKEREELRMERAHRPHHDRSQYENVLVNKLLSQGWLQVLEHYRLTETVLRTRNPRSPARSRAYSSVIPDSEADTDELALLETLTIPFSPALHTETRVVRYDSHRPSATPGDDYTGILHDPVDTVPESGSGNHIVQYIPTTPPRLKQLREQLSRKSWRHILDDLDDIVKLNMDCPALIPADQCWRTQVPAALDVKVYCIDLPSEVRDDIIFERAGQKVKTTLGNVLRHIDHPCDTPYIAHNVPMNSFDYDLNPYAISKYSKFDLIVPETVDEYSMNITPRNVIVDVHIDQGTNGLSICVGTSGDPGNHCARKIWLLWPPTKHNMMTFETMKRRNKKGHTILEQDPNLEQGIIADPKTDYGIFLPSGWLHATITIEGGFLVGKTFNSPATVFRSSQVLAVDCRLAGALQPGLYEETLALAMCAEELAFFEDAVKGWLVHLEPTLRKTTKAFRKYAARQDEWRAIEQIWKDACQTHAADFRVLATRICPSTDCGWTGAPTRFHSHFRTVHIEQLFAFLFGERGPGLTRTPDDEDRASKRRRMIK